MTIYSVVNFKGGVGKSLTTVQLAAWLLHNNFSVAVIDNDRQRSVADWLEEHSGDITVVETDNHVEMEKAIYLLQDNHDVVLVDNGGRDLLSMNIVMQISDRILIPVQPSALDINSTLDTIEQLKLARRRIKKDIQATVFLNRVIKGSKIVREVRDVFKTIEGINFSSVEIPQTVRISELSGHNESVFDCKKNADLAALYDNMFSASIAK